MLTLGMTRKNILLVFASETAVTFVLSLAVGIGVGLVFYQTTLLILTNFLETEFFLATYSPLGMFVTVVMVGGVYLLSSAASLLYLRYTKIIRLRKKKSDGKDDETPSGMVYNGARCARHSRRFHLLHLLAV